MARNPWLPPEAKLAETIEPDHRKPLAVWLLQGLISLATLGLLVSGFNDLRLWMSVPWAVNRGQILASCAATVALAVLCAWLVFGIQRRSPIARWLAAILQAATLAISVYVLIVSPFAPTTPEGLVGSLTAAVLIVVPQILLLLMASLSERAGIYYNAPKPARS